MKKRICFLWSIILLVLVSCQPPVVFDAPQPVDVTPLTGFPKRLEGKYLSSLDNSVLQITSGSLIRYYDFDMKIHISQLDSSQQLIGDTLFDLKTNRGTIIVLEGDSVVQHVNEIDTLFTIDALNVLKKFKGCYFVNTCTSPTTWQVQKLEFTHGLLTLSSINNKEDIEQLKALTETPQDTMPYVFSPSRKEFKNFVKNEGFRSKEVFGKIRE
jgi:hypothetical protein